MTIHDEIRTRREALGWSQARLAQEVSRLERLPKPLSYVTVQHWENGASAPKRTRLQFVAQALGCTAEQLNNHGQPGDTPLDWRTLAMNLADNYPDPMIREALNIFCAQVDADYARLSQKLQNRDISGSF